MLALWSRLIGPVTDHGDGDVEDFYEQAARLEAALSHIGPDDLWVDAHDGSGLGRNAATAMTRPLAELGHLRRYGVQDTGQALSAALAEDRLADEYATLDAFHRHAGRRIVVCGHFTSRGPQLAETVLDIAGVEGGRVVVKATKAKQGFWIVDVPAGATADQVASLLYEELDWTLVRLAECEGAFLVQEWQPMEFEYRLFIVDGKPVTGAGAVEEHTPLDNRAPFDPALRQDRAAETAVVNRPDITERLVAFGAVVAAEIATENPELRTYVLDVALDRSWRPLVVEINGLLNSGLYASDPRLVVGALVA